VERPIIRSCILFIAALEGQGEKLVMPSTHTLALQATAIGDIASRYGVRKTSARDALPASGNTG